MSDTGAVWRYHSAMRLHRHGLVRLSLAAAVLLTSFAAPAGPKPPGAFTAAPKPSVAPPAPSAAPPAPPAQPDVSIYDLSVDADCHIVVHLTNAGGAPVPATTTSIALQMSGANKSGWTVKGDALPREPGAKTTFTVPTFRVNGSISQTAALNGVGPDLSVANNSRTETLTCSSKFADLALSVTTKPDCTKVIELANVGDAAPTPNTWAALSVIRSVDGIEYQSIPVSTIDPGRALQNPGGKASFTEPAMYRAYDKYAYSLPYPYQEKNDNKANNAVSASVPSQCRAARPPIDLALTEVKLDNSCRLVATAKNTGTNALPPIKVTTTFFKNGVSAGSWSFDAAKASAPGSEAIVYGPFLKETGPVTVKVVIDSTSVLAEMREDNNTTTATLTCTK